MLEYEWGNPPSTVMLTGDDPGPDSDHSRQIFDDHYAAAQAQAFNDNLLLNPSSSSSSFTHFHQPITHSNNYQTQLQAQTQAHPYQYSLLYDPRAASYPPPAHSPAAAMLSLDPSGGFFTGPKSEPGDGGGGGVVEFGSRIGLNLGGRTYFSSAEDDFVNRLYRRSRPGETGSVNSPRCQAEGCNADLTHSKHYHRRHKVCEFHSKAATVVAAGLTQRFCQQCSRFHVLLEFDNGKRSCRKRLADHNRRRRKSHQPNNHETKSHLENARSSPSDNQIPRSPADSGAHSSSSVTVAISPPRISLDCFRQRSYQAATSSSPSTSSVFFSNG